MQALSQPGILAEIPQRGRYLTYVLLTEPQALSASLQQLAALSPEFGALVGLGPALLEHLQTPIEGMQPFQSQTAGRHLVPATLGDLWIWLRGEDPGALQRQTLQLQQLLAPAFKLHQSLDSFRYLDFRDLSGYEDGTENPEGEEATTAALVEDGSVGMAGSSFVAVQQWQHDLAHFDALPEADRDNIIGRHLADNEEFDEAPESAHVKRTAQESFTPEAFMLRRSMPWAEGLNSGLVFVAFGASFYPFETILKRMCGNEDGIIDSMFSFSQPLTGNYYWCPPLLDNKLDLRALGID